MIRYAAAVTAAAIVASAAQATLLAPAGSIFMPAGFAAAGTPASGVMSSPFSNANFQGTLLSQVYTNVAGSPYAGGYTFVYVVVNDGTSTNSLERLTINGFAGFQTDYTWENTGGGVAPVAADRSFGIGDVMGSFFGAFGPGYSTIGPGQNSAAIVIHTDATVFGTNIASVIDGLTANVPAYAPVPVPGAAGLLGLGLLASSRRRRS